jgi:threonine dehydratase
MNLDTTEDFGLPQVLAAQRRLSGAVAFTPCIESPRLSARIGCQVFCKHEQLQVTGSFKERGARNALSLLSPAAAKRGVIAASAGNHALGLAWHGRELGIPVTVVMPRTAPQVKIDRCRALGARVCLMADTFDETSALAVEMAANFVLTNIHPFNDPAVIAGQGTIALEVLQQVPDLDALVVPVGGGGLLAGVATAIRALRPELSVIGVEPEHASCFSQALRCGRPVRVATRRTLADGLAVAQTERRAFNIASARVDRILTVSEEDLSSAIRLLAQEERAVIEGAGAASLAALISGQVPELVGKRVVLLLTGRNIDPAVHRHALAGGNKEERKGAGSPLGVNPRFVVPETC